MAQQEKKDANAFLFALFKQSMDELKGRTDEDRNEEQKALEHFAQATGVPYTAPLTFYYAGFRIGIERGIKLAEEMRSTSIERS